MKHCARVSCIEAADLLRAGRLVLVPTETVYGIAGDPRVAGIEEMIYAAKARDRGKPIPLLAHSLEAVETFGAQLNDAERTLAQAFWPGPLTLILKVKGDDSMIRKFDDSEKEVFQVSGFRFQPSEGFRVPDCEVTLKLLRAAGYPLRVTSANISGEAPAVTEAQAIAALGEHVAGIVAWDGQCAGEPSTVVRIADCGIEMLREGALSREQLETVLKKVDP